MADNSYAQLIDDYENGILVEPGETLTQYIDRMGGVDYKADGGSIGIEVLFQPKREEYQTGGISVGGSTSLASLRRQGYKPDSRATLQDYTGALRSVSACTTAQQQADAKRYARNEAANELRAALRNSVGMRPSSTSPISNLYNNYGFNTLPGGSRLFGKQGNNFTGVMKQYGNNSDYDKVLDKMVSEKLQPTEYSQPKIDQRRQEAEAAQYDLYSQAFGKKMEDTYGKASDYAAEAMTLGMPVEAYYDYLATGDEKDLNYKYQQAIDGITNPYYDEKFSSYSDIYGPELPRNPYQQYFQSELQRQTSAGIPVGQRIQQGQVLGLPTVLSGGAPGSQMGPGYESYADVLARNKKMMGLRDGGRVGLFMGGDPLTGQALSIYESMNAYGFTDQEIANALEGQGLYTPGSTTTTTTTTPVINKALNIINKDGGDGDGGGGGPKGSGLGLSRFDYGYTPVSGNFDIDDIGEGTVYDEDYTLGMRLGDLGTGIKGGIAKAYNDLRSLPTPFNLASKAIGNISDFTKAQAAKAAAALAAAKSRAESQRQYDSKVHGPNNYGLGSDGKQSYDSGQGFGINATTGGPVSNRTGRGRTDYKDGGLATLFNKKR